MSCSVSIVLLLLTAWFFFFFNFSVSSVTTKPKGLKQLTHWNVSYSCKNYTKIFKTNYLLLYLLISSVVCDFLFMIDTGLDLGSTSLLDIDPILTTEPINHTEESSSVRELRSCVICMGKHSCQGINLIKGR